MILASGVVRFKLDVSRSLSRSLVDRLQSRGFREISARVFEARGRDLRPGEYTRTEGGRFLLYRDLNR